MAPVVPPAQPVPGSPEHDAAMVAKVDALEAANASATGTATAAPAAPVTRPDNVPEKFWDAAKGSVNQDALLQSYIELEKARSAPVVPPVVPPATTPPAAGDTPPTAPPGAPAGGKLDFAAIAAEVNETGKISEASFTALEAVGLGREVASQFIAGQQALAAQKDAAGFALAGGAEQYKAMVTWAGTSFTPAERAAFDKAVDGDTASMTMAVSSLKARYEAANGRDPVLAAGGGPAGGDQGAFASRAEVTAAMRDPRYKNDPAYRAAVERRTGAMSNF